MLDPTDFIITRKRKKYKFALFANSPLCYEFEQWDKNVAVDSIEIGAGTGFFSVALAELHPDWQCVAIDVKADRLQYGAHAAAKKGLANVRFLRARADQLLEVFKPRSLRTIWLTFPDPFPKKRAAKNRLTHPRFLALYAQLLSPGGTLCFKTDAHGLFSWSLEQLVSAGWQIQELSFDLHESDLPDEYKIKTTYESRFTAEGLPTHFLRATPPVR